MADTDAQPAAPSAAPVAPSLSAVDQAVASGDVAAFKAARHAERMGKPLDVPAESSPAPAVEQPASKPEVSEQKPESVPGDPPKKNADTRVQELLRERHEIRQRAEAAERRLAELEQRLAPPTETKQPAESSPAAVGPITYPPDLASYDAHLSAHPDASYEDYLDARADFRFEQKETARQHAQEAAKRLTAYRQTVQERNTQFAARIEQAKTADPMFLDHLSDEVKGLRPFDAIRDASGRWTEQPTGYHAIAEELLTSEVAPHLMRHFSDHPEELHRIAKLLPAHLLKEMGKLEAKLSTPAKPVPPPKTVTDAPEPPLTLGSKPGSPVDSLDAAVASGDVAAYMAAKRQKRLAAMR